MAGKTGYAPGWFARCTKCDYQVDVESLGWIRIGAYSYGKRCYIHCPRCARKRFMQVIHLDENGKPDQSLGKVLSMVLLYQAIIWLVLLCIFSPLVFIWLWR